MQATFQKLLAFFFALVFALLISDTTAGLASRLARSLAFAASAIFCAVAKIASFKGFDVLLHKRTSQVKYNIHIISPHFQKVNTDKASFLWYNI